jgi:hypothetical protein
VPVVAVVATAAAVAVVVPLAFKPELQLRQARLSLW